MSEQILETPQNTRGQEGVLPGIEAEPASRAGRNRSFVVVGLAIVGGLIIGGVIIFLIRPFSSEPAVDPAVAAAAAAAVAEAQEQAKGTQEVGEVVPKRTRVKLTSRDPFAVLVPEPPPPEPPKKSAGSDGGSSSSSSSTAATLSALTIKSPAAVTVKVDGKKYSVDEGETFASSYRLYDIFNDSCAGFLYGDQNVVVCEGDSVKVG